MRVDDVEWPILIDAKYKGANCPIHPVAHPLEKCVIRQGYVTRMVDLEALVFFPERHLRQFGV